MNKEAGGHIDPLEALRILFSGYFDGRIDEIKEEIRQVEEWTQGVMLGSQVRRKEQELGWLSRLKREMERAKTYVDSSISKELKK